MARKDNIRDKTITPQESKTIKKGKEKRGKNIVRKMTQGEVEKGKKRNDIRSRDSKQDDQTMMM